MDITSYLPSDLFAGQVAFITGGGSGINLGIAKAFAELGADVGICGRSAERLEGAAAELEGFGATVVDPDDRRSGEILRAVEPEDLLRFGLIPEFIGRLPVLATLEDLDEEALVEILSEPKNALVKQYQRLFEMESIKLTITHDALKSIARKAIERKTGARGLRSIMEGILLDTMFELPSLKGVEEVVIGPEVVEGGAMPLKIYAERAEEQETSA